MSVQSIVENNKKIGVHTIFFSEDNGIFGYTQDGIIYLNDFYNEDLEIVNKHEMLHLFEESKQFNAIKKLVYELINETEIMELRNQYYLKYNLLYSEEEIKKGIIDNEIIIDMIINNGNFPIRIEDYIDDPYSAIVSKTETINLTSKGKKYLSFIVDKNTKNRYKGLEKWGLFFANDYYKGKEKPKGKDRFDKIFKDARNESDKLLQLSNKHFIISVENNPYLDRRLQEQIDTYKASGDIDKAKELEENHNKYLNELANNISENLWTQYCNVVSNNLLYDRSKYDDAFRCLIVNEMLTKIYRYENGNRIVEKRIPHKTISPFILVNKYVLDYMYNNVNDYVSFTDLYFDALEKYNDEFLNNGQLVFNRNDLGYWIRFTGREAGSKELEINAQNLGNLIRDTPWCTKKDPKLWITDNREFLVFVDNFNMPHIAVSINDGELEEVRGIKGNQDQEIEDEYRKITIDFLNDNSYIYNSEEWLEKEERNQRLYVYLKMLRNNKYTLEDLKKLVKDLNKKEINRHGEVNSNEKEIIKIIEKDSKLKNDLLELALEQKAARVIKIIKDIECNQRILEYYNMIEKGNLLPQLLKPLHEDLKHHFLDPIYIENKENLLYLLNNKDNLYRNILANRFNCKPDEVYIGSITLAEYRYQNNCNNFPYKYVMGDLFMAHEKDVDISNLIEVYGDIVSVSTERINFASLIKVHGSLDVSCSECLNMPVLIEVKKDLTAYRTEIVLPSLRYIGGSADLNSCFMEECNSIEKIDGDLILSSYLKKMERLRYVGGTIDFSQSGSFIITFPSLECFTNEIDAPNNFQTDFIYDEKLKHYVKRNFKR